MGFGQILSCVNADRLKCPWELLVIIGPHNLGGSSDGKCLLT